MSSHDLLSEAPSGRPLTGWATFWIAVGCFGVVFAANGIMAYFAISTFRGETDPSAYQHGLAYQKDIEAAKAQAALGWKVTAHVARDGDGQAAVAVRMLDASGAPVTGIGVTAGFDAPADKKLDASLTLIETAPGVYAGRLNARPGQWDLRIEAARDGAAVFKSTNRITLR